MYNILVQWSQAQAYVLTIRVQTLKNCTQAVLKQ